MTGGTGFVGSTLTRKLTENGHEVTVLTRTIQKGRVLPKSASFLEGNPTKKGPWQQEVGEHDVVINLAGASIFSRWTEKNKRAIRESRIFTTKHLVEALAALEGRKATLLSTSAVGYYGFHEDEVLDENSPAGNDFLASVASEWEDTALEAKRFGVRVVLCRFGIVLGKHGGVLDKMVPIFKVGLGSQFGSGKQWFSWIHKQDLANIFLFLLEKEDLEGPINCTAPNPVRNNEFTKLLAETVHKPRIVPTIPGFLLKSIIGELGSVLLKGQRVIPRRLSNNAFRFQFPTMKEALEDLLKPLRGYKLGQTRGKQQHITCVAHAQTCDKATGFLQFNS